MADSLDIHNLLQTGYFTTSRAKTAQIPTLSEDPSPLPLPVLYNGPSRTRTPDVLPPKPFARPPPPPIVEDEAESLAKEHGSPSVRSLSHEEPQSRGDIDQNPIMMEVHEHNPERRFVILTGSSPEPEDARKVEPAVDKSSEANIGRKQESAPSHEPSRNLDHPTKGPSLERRKSRQDLPRLETDLESDAPAHHRRSRSNTGNSRPAEFPAQQSRRDGDTLLTPDVVKHGTGRREKVYHGYGKPSDGISRSPVQISQSAVDSRPRMGDADYDTRRTGSSEPKRSSTSAEPGRPARRLSNERVGGPRVREDYPIRTSRRENSRPYERPEGDKSKSNLGRPPWDNGRDEHPLGPRMPGTRREKTVVVQEDSSSAPSHDKVNEGSPSSRSRTRMPTMPLPSPKLRGPPDGRPLTPRGAATFPLADNDDPTKDRPPSQLPYPEEDVILMPSMGVDFDIDPLMMPPPPAVPTHGVPLAAPAGPPFDGMAAGGFPQVPASASTPMYQPPPFDPARDGANLDLPMGSYRRHSESAGQAEALPECPRSKPVAGMMDWLTLPRSDFNICPDCYQGVFANTSFRTQFQPMLRPTDKPIACDFGASPWYRVAWLLVLKNRQGDLRLFHQLAGLMNASRAQPCPGNRRATRNWLTVRDPSTQRTVRGFTVCYQCAKVVETLLPNLTGIFVPLDSRGEPVRATCALHFTPKRRRFVLYFDALELASDKALGDGKPPDVSDLARQLGKLSVGSECREDSPVSEGLWHVMQFLPKFTVCGECFDEVVRPRLNDDNIIAKNFYTKPQRLASATCQLYSERMRDIFAKACRRNDPVYLEDKVLERMRVESDIHAKLEKLDREGRNDEWVAEQVAKLVREWQRWE